MSIAREVADGDEHVVVSVEFPEFAIDDIKVLVGEVGCKVGDIGFGFDLFEDFNEFAFSELLKGDLTVSMAVVFVQESRQDSVDVSSLEDGAVPQKLETRTDVDQLTEERPQI